MRTLTCWLPLFDDRMKPLGEKCPKRPPHPLRAGHKFKHMKHFSSPIGKWKIFKNSQIMTGSLKRLLVVCIGWEDSPMYVYQSISYPHLSTVWGNFLRCLQMPSIIWPDTKKDNWLWPLSLVYLLEKKYIYIFLAFCFYIYTLVFDCLSRTIHLDRFKWDNVWYT